MYILEVRDMAGMWRILGEYNTYEELRHAQVQYLADCNSGDYPYYTNIVILADLAK
jgi:hypothetical protein